MFGVQRSADFGVVDMIVELCLCEGMVCDSCDGDVAGCVLSQEGVWLAVGGVLCFVVVEVEAMCFDGLSG